MMPGSAEQPVIPHSSCGRNWAEHFLRRYSCSSPESHSQLLLASSCRKDSRQARLRRLQSAAAPKSSRSACSFGFKSLLFRVDILSTIGVSMMLMGVMCWIVLAGIYKTRGPGRAGPGWAGDGTRPYATLVVAAGLLCAAISASTPLLWTNWRPRFLPWELETYINGVHNLGAPQPWLFPIFPWSAFAFAGLVFGLVLMSERARKVGAHIFFLVGGAGLILIYGAKFLDSRGPQ